MSDHQSMYYGYLVPGVYDYPVTHSAASTPSAYSWEPIMASSGSSNWCAVPVQNAATYVAGPLGGVINYVTDMQSHLALPNSHTLATGLIYTALAPIQEQEEEEETTYPHQSMLLQHYDGMELEDFELRVPPSGFCLAHMIALPPREEEEDTESDPDQRGDPQPNSTVEISEELGSGATQDKVIPKRKKRTHKRVFKSKRGYLVEEPTSEEEENAPEELPTIAKA